MPRVWPDDRGFAAQKTACMVAGGVGRGRGIIGGYSYGGQTIVRGEGIKSSMDSMYVAALFPVKQRAEGHSAGGYSIENIRARMDCF